MNEDLLKVLSDQLDCKSSNSKIINLEPLTGGASKEIWKFEIQSELERGKYILRRGSGIEGPLGDKDFGRSCNSEKCKENGCFGT